jgi:mannitol-specific phosphotransferase system IIBC component
MPHARKRIHMSKTQEQVTRVNKITRFIFWIAFLAFLSTSIPHVAWLYHIYEPVGKGDTTIFGISIWWVLCYAIAIGIDVLIAWLSFVQTMKKGDIVTWIFIALLSILSWYANYLYDMNNNPIVQQSIWKITLLWGSTTTGFITPIIVSAIPMFVIAYTFMLSRIQASSSVLSPEELKAQNDMEERLLAEKKRQATLKRDARNFALKGTVAGIVDMVAFTTQAIQTGLQDVQGNHATIDAVQEDAVQEDAVQESTAKQDTQNVIQTALDLPVLSVTHNTEPIVTALPVLSEPGKTNGHALPVYRSRPV